MKPKIPSGIMSALNTIYRFLSHSAVRLVVVAIIVAFAFIFHDFFIQKYQTWTIFTRAEAVAVFLALVFSFISYDKSVDSIISQTSALGSDGASDDKYHLQLALFLDQLFAILNMVLFAFAIVVIANPVLHVLLIQTVLFAFALNNFFQKGLALKLQTPKIRHKAVIRAMDMHHWLFSENGPGVLGYLLVIAFLSSFGHWRHWFLDSNHLPRFAEFLEALTTGAAGYQICLSTAVYLGFHHFRTGRAFEFEGFALTCGDEKLIKHIRKMGPGWFMWVVVAIFVLSIVIVATRFSSPSF